MAMTNRKSPYMQHWIVRLLPLRTLQDAQNLVHRFQEGKALRLYVSDRMRLLMPVGLLMLVISVTCAAATMVILADTHPLLALPALLLVPVVLVGSLFVQFYVFFSWLENRALARALGHRAKRAPGALAAWLSSKFGVDMGDFPPVPWVLATIVLFAPLGMLASFAFEFALGLIVLAALAPILYARFDR